MSVRAVKIIAKANKRVKADGPTPEEKSLAVQMPPCCSEGLLSILEISHRMPL